MFWFFFSQALQKGKNTFYSEVFALAVYPAAGNSFLLYTETDSQQNISKMYLPFNSESHPKNPHVFRILRFIIQYCRMNRLQNCVRALRSPGGMWG